MGPRAKLMLLKKADLVTMVLDLKRDVGRAEHAASEADLRAWAKFANREEQLTKTFREEERKRHEAEARAQTIDLEPRMVAYLISLLERRVKQCETKANGTAQA